jgi:hypothetical protein
MSYSTHNCARGGRVIRRLNNFERITVPNFKKIVTSKCIVTHMLIATQWFGTYITATMNTQATIG